ncbi:MAG: rhomboid family intramembrane serine protease [Candidatus Krumholzibacteriia bacterium]
MYFFYFYPLGLDRPLRRPPVLTITLMAVMAVGFIWLRYLPRAAGFDPWWLVFFPGQPPWWSVGTAVFMHAGWLHLVGNLLYLWVFAPPLEDRLGRARFFLVAMICGVAGNLVHAAVSLLGWMGQGGMGVMGASGAIAGLLGFSLLRLYDARLQVAWWVLAPLVGQNRAGRSRIPLWGAVAVWVLWQLVQALLAGETGSTVSFGAHLGGVAAGIGLALLLGEHRKGREEACLRRGESYRAQGHFHAAAGELSGYVESRPDDPDGRRELARALLLSGDATGAGREYRKAADLWLAAGRIDLMLEAADEWIRQCGGQALRPEELAGIAFYREKSLDHAGAREAYRQLYEAYPRHPEGHRALVRLVVLCRGKLADPVAALRWLEEARDSLPPGSWRDYLSREFALPAGPDGAWRSDPVPAGSGRPGAGSSLRP